MTMTAMDGMLLFAHGARDPAWAGPFEAVERRIAAARPGMPLALAYLEFMQPTIADAAHQLAARGCSRIHIVPMFLGAGGHVRRDIPPLIDALRAQYGPGVEWILHPALGDQPGVMQAMAEASLSFVPPNRPEDLE
jgi:sirohydrochlorin cobaltochelatase